jgi:hypothetical protein
MIRPLCEDIKFNCDISDAQYWGYFSICGLLMRYRDLFRSEQGLEPWAPIEREAISRWIQQKESRWPQLEDASFRDLSLDGQRCGPFDSTALNGILNAQGFVYGAGYGMYLKPTFFLARTRSVAEVEGHRVYTTDEELVRDLFTSPAMLQDRSIFLRLDPLKAILWERYSQLAPGRCSMLERSFQAFGIGPGQSVTGELHRKIERMADVYAGVLLRHELAESFETVPAWKDILAAARDRKAELYLRAVQDLLADTSERGPLQQIVETRNEGALALFLGLLEGYRRVLFPELREAYDRFIRDDRDWAMIDDVRRAGFRRSEAVRGRVLDLAEERDRDGFLEGLRELMQG